MPKFKMNLNNLDVSTNIGSNAFGEYSEITSGALSSESPQEVVQVVEESGIGDLQSVSSAIVEEVSLIVEVVPVSGVSGGDDAQIGSRYSG